MYTSVCRFTRTKKNTDRKSIECFKNRGSYSTNCRHVYSHCVTPDVIDSAFATESAQRQLKGVRPCQSIQERWQTVQMCVKLQRR